MTDCDLSRERLERLTADYFAWREAVASLHTDDGRNWCVLKEAVRHLDKAKDRLEYYQRWASGRGLAQQRANQRRRRMRYRQRKAV